MTTPNTDGKFVTVRCPACMEEVFTVGPVHFDANFMDESGLPIEYLSKVPLAGLNMMCASYVEHVIETHTGGVSDGSTPVTGPQGMDETIRKLLDDL